MRALSFLGFSSLLILLNCLFSYAEVQNQEESNAPIATSAYKVVSLEDIREPLSFEDAMRIAVEKFPAVQAAQMKLMAATESIHLAKTAYYPSLVIFSQTNGGNRNKLPGALFPEAGALPIQGPTTQHPTYQMAFGTFNGSLLNWDVYDFGLRHSQVEKAQTIQSEASANECLTRFNVLSEASKRFLEDIVAKENIKAAQANLARNKVFLDVVTALVKSGRPGVDEVRARTDLIQAQTQVILAMQQEEIANYALATALGMAGHQVEIDTTPFTDTVQNFPISLLNYPIQETHPLLAAQQKSIDVIKAHQNVLTHSYYPTISYPTISLQAALNGRGSGFKPSGEFARRRVRIISYTGSFSCCTHVELQTY